MTDSSFDWEAFLGRHRDEIVDQWRKRLRYEVSDQYSQRPAGELTRTTGRACDSFCRMIAGSDDGPINEFIGEITRIRLEAGFALHDVQKAFELYRQIVTPILIRESPPELVFPNIEAVNRALAYTIHRFSFHFQKMHEKHLTEYAQQLEQDVASRTAELRESEHKYKTLVEDISDGYLVLRRMEIVFVNPAFCRMHGYDEIDLSGTGFLLLVDKESQGIIEKNLARTIQIGTEPEAFEYRRLTKNGKRLPTEISFRPSRFSGRDYNLCIVRDITRRVEMEKKSRKLERMAYIGQLTTSLSHEIRNPLSSVKMNLQILGKNPLFQGNDKKRLDISESEIKRLEGILQELLDVAKPVSLQLSGVDINQMVFSCADLMEARFSKRNIRFEIQADPGLPGIAADKGKMEQVIINLLLNALEAVEDAGYIRISTGRKKLKKKFWAVIRVEDDGRGISKKDLPHIFEPFFTTRPAGTGLGLSNVKQIVTAHDGSVRVVGSKGKGAVFEVRLPLGEFNG